MDVRLAISFSFKGVGSRAGPVLSKCWTTIEAAPLLRCYKNLVACCLALAAFHSTSIMHLNGCRSLPSPIHSSRRNSASVCPTTRIKWVQSLCIGLDWRGGLDWTPKTYTTAGSPISPIGIRHRSSLAFDRITSYGHKAMETQGPAGPSNPNL